MFGFEFEFEGRFGVYYQESLSSSSPSRHGGFHLYVRRLSHSYVVYIAGLMLILLRLPTAEGALPGI